MCLQVEAQHAGRVTVWGACREEPDWQSSSTAEMPIEIHNPGCHGECWLRCPGTLPDMTRWSTEESTRCISTWSQDRFHHGTFPSGRVREALTHQSTSALPGPKSRTRGCNRLCLAHLSRDVKYSLRPMIQLDRHEGVSIPPSTLACQDPLSQLVIVPIFYVSTLVSPPTGLCPTF